MTPAISVIICTHNPRPDYLNRVLTALQHQTLPYPQWELLVVDNGSQPSLQLDVSWHPAARIIREAQLGLTFARLSGFRAAQAPILVYVDDDNVLDANYLSQVIAIFAEHPGLGAIAGKSVPEFEVTPPTWVAEFDQLLALRDFGNQPLIQEGSLGAIAHQPYPEFAPAGIGLAVRRQAFLAYIQRVKTDPNCLRFGRNGQQLTSGEDNDIVLTLLNAGWKVGYFPQLQLTHLIAARRVQRQYLAQLNRAACRSWIQVLDAHGIRTWSKIPVQTVQLRQVKAFFAYQAWRNAVNYIRWQGACGTYEALAGLS